MLFLKDMEENIYWGKWELYGERLGREEEGETEVGDLIYERINKF